MKHTDTLLYGLIMVIPGFALQLLVLVALMLQGCGDGSSSSGGATESSAPETEITAQSDKTAPRMLSITLASASDLPECSEASETLLAYVKDEDQFYTCKDLKWSAIDIEGEDGRDGQNGVTTVKEIEATNKKNQWVDPVSGLEWLLGGNGTYAVALTACAAPYRIPVYSEAEAAFSRGLRTIVATTSAGTTFWIDELNAAQTITYVAHETANVAAKSMASVNSSYAIYCVK